MSGNLEGSSNRSSLPIQRSSFNQYLIDVNEVSEHHFVGNRLDFLYRLYFLTNKFLILRKHKGNNRDESCPVNEKTIPIGKKKQFTGLDISPAKYSFSHSNMFDIFKNTFFKTDFISLAQTLN